MHGDVLADPMSNLGVDLESAEHGPGACIDVQAEFAAVLSAGGASVVYVVAVLIVESGHVAEIAVSNAVALCVVPERVAAISAVAVRLSYSGHFSVAPNWPVVPDDVSLSHACLPEIPVG